MIQKNLLLCSLLFLFFSPIAYAHDFDDETFSFILSNPNATLTEFENVIRSSHDYEMEARFANIDTKIIEILALPGKKYLANYAVNNPDFTYSDIKEQIWDDPMLSELWAEVLYSFLSERLQEKSWYDISFDFFIKIIQIWLTHILSGIDHILFVITLIILLPKKKHILALISVFTLAHSLTIILGWFKIITLPSMFVESMILVSIVITALYAFFSKIWEQKNTYIELSIVFVLGLFHWLGFAWFFSGVIDVSSNIVFPILAFNIWVEIGQILIILLSFYILTFLYKYLPKYKDHIKNVIAVICILFAVYMLVGMYL